MKLTLFALALVFTSALPLASPAQSLDAYWADVSRTVQEGDFDGYAALYHEDAVLVSNFSKSSVPISSALAGWKQGFTDTREGKIAAEVTFRFSQRYSDGATAHETGIFRYVATPADGEPSEQFIHFEGLLVKKDSWKMMMEFQKSPATTEEWKGLE
jgi:ketosteroid isomerase-like protein